MTGENSLALKPINAGFLLVLFEPTVGAGPWKPGMGVNLPNEIRAVAWALLPPPAQVTLRDMTQPQPKVGCTDAPAEKFRDAHEGCSLSFVQFHF